MHKRRRTIRAGSVLYAVVCAAGALWWIFSGAAFASVLLLLLLLYALFAGIALLQGGAGIRISFDAGGETAKGEVRLVDLRVQNALANPFLSLDGVFSIRNVITQETKRQHRTLALRPKGESRLSFSVSDPHCGLLLLEAEDLRITDPLGIFSRRYRGENATARIYCMPAAEEIAIEEALHEHYDMESYRFAEQRTGSDPSETVGIRAYRAGDRIRSIHWKLSAKNDETLIREAGYPVDTTILVLADKTMPQALDVMQMEKATELASSISLSLQRAGRPHMAAWYDASVGHFVQQRVSSDEDVYQMSIGLISAPFFVGEAHAAEQFLASELDKRFATILYVTTGDGDEAEQYLGDYGQIAVFNS